MGIETRHILGRFVLSSRCANGDRLVNLVSTTRLVVSSTHVQQPQRHLVTWHSETPLRKINGESARSTHPNIAFLSTDTPAVELYSCEDNPPSLDEVCMAIRQLRNSRASGEDDIPAESYKTCLDSLGPWLRRAIVKVWSSKTISNNCSGAVHLLLFKKRDKRTCS